MVEKLKFQRKKPLTIAVKGLCGAGEQIRTLGNSVIARTCGFPFLGKPTKSLENLQQIK